jgi:predicted nucleic acid-binding protein
MKKYLLDTSICVFLFRDNHDVAQRLNKIGRERLKDSGKPIEDFDLLIGCAAKAAGLTIVTHNVKHFSHIEGLDIEDWIK